MTKYTVTISLIWIFNFVKLAMTTFKVLVLNFYALFIDLYGTSTMHVYPPFWPYAEQSKLGGSA